MALPKLTKEQRAQAPETAAREGREREARGEREPLDEWPAGPPDADQDAMERYLVAFRQWHEKHVGPVSEADWRRVRADHGLDT